MAHRCAIVTGGGRGIGRAIATRLAEDGYDIAVIDLDAEGAAETAEIVTSIGRRALSIQANVADEAEVESAVTRVSDELGAPLVLVNNAGLIRDDLLFKAQVIDWDLVMAVHLRGPFLMSRAVQRHMVDSRWGRIINISSTSALGNRGQSNYSAAKAGIQGFTKTLALELGKFGVTANAVAPGFIETDMTRSTAERRGMSFEALIAEAESFAAVGRTGKPEDIAQAVSFFADARSGFVSGQVLYVAGGPFV